MLLSRRAFAPLIASLIVAACSPSEESTTAPPPPEKHPQLSIAGVSADEGNTGTTAFKFRVSLDRAATETVRVRYRTESGTAKEGQDFTKADSELQLAIGATEGFINIVVLGDTVVEPDERFTVRLHGANGAQIAVDTAEGVIRNDDVANRAPIASAGADQFADEGATVTLDGSDSLDPDGAIASYAWTQLGGPAVILSGANTAVATFTAPEGTGDPQLTFRLTVTDTHGAKASDDVQVTALDTRVLSIADGEALEADGALVFNVTLTPAAGRPVTVEFATADASARSPGDYAGGGGTLTLPKGAASAEISIPVNDDAFDENDERFTLGLSAANGAVIDDGLATGTIRDDDTSNLLRIGAAKRSITPTQAQIDGVEEPRAFGAGTHVQKFNLGGFGINPVQSTPDPAGNMVGEQLTEPASQPVFRNSRNVLEHTFIRAFAVEQKDGDTVVFLMMDAVGAGNIIQKGVKNAVIAAAAEQGVTLAPENILFGQTHTHAGADLQGLWGGVPQQWISEILYPAAADAVREALQQRQAAHLSFRQGHTNEFNNYRRPRINPAADADGTLTLLEAVADDGTPIGSVLQYNAHPTSVNVGGNRIPHADYILGAMEWLEGRNGGTALYYNGPIADASGSSGRAGCAPIAADQPYSGVRCRGEGMANYLLDPANALASRELAPTVAARSVEVYLPVTNPGFLAFGLTGTFNRYYNFMDVVTDTIPGIDPYLAELPQLTPAARTHVSRVTLGGADGLEIVTIPGETTGTFGDYIRGLAGTNVMLLGLTHNSFGYILPEEEFGYVDQTGDAGLVAPFTGYEENVSLGPLTAPMLRTQGYNVLFDQAPEANVPPTLSACLEDQDSPTCILQVAENRVNLLLAGLQTCVQNGLGSNGCPFSETIGFFDPVFEGIAGGFEAIAQGCRDMGGPDEMCDAFAAAGSAAGNLPHTGTGPLVERKAEPVVMEGKSFPDWSQPAAFGLANPYPSGVGGDGEALTEPFGLNVRNAHNGQMLYPPAGFAGLPTAAKVGEIAAFRFQNGAWVEIPVQVDERFPYFLANANSDFSFYSGTDMELTYAWDRETWDAAGQCYTEYPAAMPDPVPGLDDDDEVVFMAQDAGAQAPVGAAGPEGAGAGQEVALADPLTPGALKYVYLFRRPGGSSFGGAHYVEYARDADANQWVDRSFWSDDDPAKLGTSNTGYGPNLSGTVCPDGTAGSVKDSTDRFPRDGMTVTTDKYKVYASGRWMVRNVHIARPGQDGVYGADIVDRWKGRAFQQSPDSTVSLVGFEDEQVNWEANSALLGERAGPVRAIREIWGADSGTNVTKTETYYRDAYVYRFRARVHPIPPDGLYTSWDYNRGAMVPAPGETVPGGRYYTALRGDGVPIDGVNDDVGQVDSVDPVADMCITSDGPQPAADFGGTCPLFFDMADPTLNLPLTMYNWEQISAKGNLGSLVYLFELKSATMGPNAAAVPYYRDDACLDDGTGDDPVQRPWPGEAYRWNGGAVPAAYDARAGRALDHSGATFADCVERQGAHAQHGIHFFAPPESDNATMPVPVDEIDGQQWAFAVPTAAPVNVGDRYANIVRVPLVRTVTPRPATDGGASAPDADGDGIADEADADDDNDGVADTVDGCPLVAGDATGCPQLAHLVGSLHEHSGYSDGTVGTTPADYFAAGSAHGLDFVMSSEHSDNAYLPVTANADCASEQFPECFQAPPEGVQKWQTTAQLAGAATRNGYSAIRGFEWTSDRFGHINVFFSANDLNAKTSTGYSLSMEDFWTWLGAPAQSANGIGGGADGLAVFNHPGREDTVHAASPVGDLAYAWNDLEYRPEHDARVVGIEQYGKSDHYYDGDNGAPAGGWYAYALDKGWHVGAVGAEDEHGTDWATPQRAKTVFLATGNSATAIRQAMEARRFYALAHHHNDIRIDYRAGSRLMGSRIRGLAGQVLSLQVAVTDADAANGLAARSIQVVGPGGEVLETATGLHHNFTATIGASEQWRYVRVLDADGKVLAVSSPIWFGSGAATGAATESGLMQVVADFIASIPGTLAGLAGQGLQDALAGINEFFSGIVNLLVGNDRASVLALVNDILDSPADAADDAAESAGMLLEGFSAQGRGRVFAGVGVVDMAPDVGYGAGQYTDKGVDTPDGDVDPYATHKSQVKSYGVVSRLTARAIVIEGANGKRVALLKSDNYLAQDNLLRRVGQILAEQGSTIRYDQILYGVTHAHSTTYVASASAGVWVFQDAYDARFFENQARKLAQAILDAERALAPARMGATTVRHKIFKGNIMGPSTGDDGTPVQYPTEYGDHGLVVMRIETDEAAPQPIAVWVNWGEHPEGLDGYDLHSADYVAYLERFVERDLGAPLVFSQGDVGSAEKSGNDQQRLRDDGTVCEGPGATQPACKPGEGVWRDWNHKGYVQNERNVRYLADAVLKGWRVIGGEERVDHAVDGVLPNNYVPEVQVSMSNAFPVDYRNAWVPGPLSHPYPAVSACRSETTVAGDPGVPNAADCARSGGFDAGTAQIWDTMKAEGLPVPENYDLPSFGALEENNRLKLQVVRLGDMVLGSCACEAQVDLILNFESRANDVAGDIYDGFDWACVAEDKGEIARDPAYAQACELQRERHFDVTEFPTHMNGSLADAARVARMRAQVHNDAAGWDAPEYAPYANAEPADPAQIKGNFTREELPPARGYKLAVGVGHAGDYNGYTVSYREFMSHDHYRKALTSYGPHTADYMVTRLVRMAGAMKGAPELKPEPHDISAEEDEVRQAAFTEVHGAATRVAFDAFHATLAPDAGSAHALEQPADIGTFTAANFTWQGGSTAVDNPRVVVERLVDGQWAFFADQTGEVQTRVQWPTADELPLVYAGQFAWRWTANFEAYESFPARLGGTPAGSYRFSVNGCFNDGAGDALAADACRSAASTYALVSEPFEVIDAAEVVQDVQVDANGDLVIRVSATSIPRSYESVFPFVRDDGGTKYCKECSFRPWAASNASVESVFVLVDGEAVAVTGAGADWSADANLAPGASATITVTYADGRVGRPYSFTRQPGEEPPPPDSGLPLCVDGVGCVSDLDEYGLPGSAIQNAVDELYALVSGAVGGGEGGNSDAALVAAAAHALTRGCDILDPSHCLLPFPNDHFTVDAVPGSPQAVPQGGSGRRVNFNLAAMPRNAAGKPIDPTEWNRNDGFSPGQMIVTYVPELGTVKDGAGNPLGPVRGAAPITDLSQSLRSDAPIFVMDVTEGAPEYGQKQLAWAEIDLNAGFLLPSEGIDQPDPTKPKRPALIVRPAKNLLEGHRYAVVLRNLQRDDGSTIAAGAAFAACLDEDFESALPPVASRCAHLRSKVFPALADAGVDLDPASLFLAWDFTVASANNNVGRLRHMRDDAFAAIGDATNLAAGDIGFPAGNAPAFSITEVRDNPSATIARQIKGTFSVPSYLVPADASPLDGNAQFRALLQQLELDTPNVVRELRSQCEANGGPEEFCDLLGEADGSPQETLLEGARVSAPPNRLFYNPADATPSDPTQAPYGDGLPDRNPAGTLSTTFTCNIPKAALSGKTFDVATAADLRAARPSLYGHGLLGGHTEGGIGSGNGQTADFGNEQNVMFCATDWFGFAFGDVPNVASVLVDVSNFPVVPDASQQGVVNFLFLARLMSHPQGFAGRDEFRLGGQPVFDTREVFYDGNSQGGILGGPVVAMSRDIHRGVLGVPGMNYSTLLTRSVDFDLYSIPLYLSYQDDLDRNFIFSMMQMLWDRSENNGYAHHITDSSALDAPANEVLLHPAFADHQVSMWTAEVMARTVGARVDRSRVTSARHPDDNEYFGLEPLDYKDRDEKLGSAFVVWDNNNQPSPPIGNTSPREGSDPHSFPRSQRVGRCQKGHFLQRAGVLIEVPSRDSEAGNFVCPAIVNDGAPGVEPPAADLPPADPDGLAGCLLTQDPALCQAAFESLPELQNCEFDESGINCAYEVLADAISVETAASFARSLLAQCQGSPAAPVCDLVRSGGDAPDRVIVASRMIGRGDLQYTEADAATPSKKTVDGASDDWMAQATRFGGTDLYEFGEHVYSDFLFDAYGADDGDDARRLAALAALGDFSDRTGRIDALQQAGGDQLGVPAPAGSTSDHYGDAATLEDGTDLTEVRWGADKDDLFLLARVARLENPANLVLVVLADQFDGEAGLTGLDAGLTTSIFDRAIVLRAGGGQIFNSAAGGTPVALDAEVSAAGYDNALEARIPRAYIERPDGSIRVAVMTLRESGGALVPANVAYRYDEPVTIYSERAQAMALFAGSVDPFAKSLTVSQLVAGRTQTARPGPGYHERQFLSGANISVEGDSENGRLQPYGVFVPTAIKTNAAGQARLTFWTHYRGGKAHSGAAWTPRLFAQLGEEQGNIVVSPRARGTSTWYTTRAHQDFFEVFADVAGTKRLNQYADENLPADHAFGADGLFEVDPARTYISGYSMGGFATYLFTGLYPDLFAGGYSTSGAVTQGAWTGVGPNPGDPGHDETCGYTAPEDFPEVGGGSPCFIEANNGRANAQLNYRILDNTRYVPLVIHHGSNDELALTPGAERMGQRLLELQYRYDMTTFLGYEHFTQAIVDEWADGARYLNLHERPENPRFVTYKVVPALVKAVNEVQLGGLNGNQPFNFHPDGAYWVDDLVVRDDDGAAHVAGRIDAESGRLAGESHQAVPRTGTEAGASDPYVSTPVYSPGNHTTPYVRHSLEWLSTGELAGDANTFSAVLANLSSARLDLARMGFVGHFGEAIDASVNSDGAATLVLANVGADMTACVNGAASGTVAAGGDAVVSIAAGNSSVRLLPGLGADCAASPPPPPPDSGGLGDACRLAGGPEALCGALGSFEQGLAALAGEPSYDQCEINTGACLSDVPVIGTLALNLLEPLLNSAPRGVWLKGDLHVHDDHSADGSGTRQTLGQGAPGSTGVGDQIAFAEGAGLDFLPLTDHRTFDQHYDPLWRSEKLLLITGEEANSSPHANVFGALDMINQADNPAGAPAFRRVQQGIWDAQLQGAAWSTNHPDDGELETDADDFPRRDAGGEVIPNNNAYATGPHLVEIWNRGTLNGPKIEYCENRWNAGYRFGVAGASDNHFRELWPVAGPGEPTTFVFASERSTPALLEGLRAGRTAVRLNASAPFVTFSGDFDNDGQFETLMGDEAQLASGATAKLRITVEQGIGTQVHVYRMPGLKAGPYKTFIPTLALQRFDFEVESRGEQDWYRVEVRGPGDPDALDYARALGGDPGAVVGGDPANPLRAISSPIFVASGAPAQPHSPELPADAGGDDHAQLLAGSVADNAFTGFASIAEADGVVHAVAEVREAGASHVVYRRIVDGEAGAAVDLVPDSPLATQPRIAAAGADVWAVWQDHRAGEIPHNPQIYARHSADGGISWDDEIQVSASAGRAAHPALALLAPTLPVIAWQDNDGGAFDVRVRVLGRDDAPVNLSAAGKTVIAGNGYDTRSAIYPASVRPSIAVSAQGAIVVAWQDNRNDSDPGWTGRTIKPEEIPDSLAAQEFIENGTETDDWEIFARALPAGASTWTTLADVSGAPTFADRNVTLAFDAAGALHAAWDSKNMYSPSGGSTQAGPRLSVRAARSADLGDTWTEAQAVALEQQYMSQRPVLGRNGAALSLFWMDGRSADWRWRVMRADYDGDAFTDARFVTGRGNAAWPSFSNGWLAFTSDRSATREQRKPQQAFVMQLEHARTDAAPASDTPGTQLTPSFDLCAGSACVSDIPVVGPVVLAALEPVLGDGTGTLTDALLAGCRDSGISEVLCARAEDILGTGGLSRWVDPRIGSHPPGFTNPGPFAPWGMVQPGPDTEGPLNFGGYYGHNALITGFSQVHMSAGVYKSGYFPVLPFTGELHASDDVYQGADHPVPAYSSSFDHAVESASVGYYSAVLSRYGVLAELTATERVGVHRYTFNDPAQPPRVLIDVSRTLDGYRNATVALRGDGVLTGSVNAGGFPVFFAARANAPFTAATFGGATLVPGAPGSGSDLGVILDFAGTQVVLMKVGISYTDEAGAVANLDSEMPGWDFDAVRDATRAKWDDALALVEVEGGTNADLSSFYTALYRVQQFPNLHGDVDGRYRGPDGNVHRDSRPHYSQFSSWDSYRGQNQVQAEIVPERYADMVHSLLAFHEQALPHGGALPRWQEGSHDASHMSGDPIIPFIGEAWCRGDIDVATRQHLWPALTHLVARRDAELLQKGYLSVEPAEPFSTTPVAPLDDAQLLLVQAQDAYNPTGGGAASATLEYGIADFSLALMARTVAGADAAPIAERSLNYRNLMDPDTKWIRPRNADGSWLTPFAPEMGYGFQEGTSWQYSWMSMHDYAGVIERMGGDAAANERLDVFFNFPASAAAPVLWPTAQNQATVFGISYIGNQYAPGNEHDLEAPYVYNYTGAPWRSQAVARAAASIYTPTPNGLPGNDDLGALSGWLVWNMAGLYPMNPGTPLAVIGSPVFEKVTFHRPGGDLVIEAPGASAANKYVQAVTIDGQATPRSWLVLPRERTHLRIELGATPNLVWATETGHRPPSLSTHPLSAFGCGNPPPPPPAAPRVDIGPQKVTIANGAFERTWTRSPFRTEQLVDVRSGKVWSQDSADFALVIGGAEIMSDRFEVSGTPSVERLPSGAVRTTFTLTPRGFSGVPVGLTVTRVIETYPGVAGMRSETWLNSALPLTISGYSLDESRVAGGVTGTIHSFRAGADWRSPGDPEEWTPEVTIGDAHAGDWRESASGASVSGGATWLSVAAADDARLFYVMERNDYASSMMSLDAGRARAHVDLSRDVIYLGPLEESGHAENPGPGPGRQRAVLPGVPLRLEPVFTGFGVDGDDEPWQHYKYLANYRMPPYRREVTFNSNNVDGNRISTGAKDDMDFAETQRQLAVAREIGVETFILDDGWQARSGDWCPDSASDDPACADPRRETDPVKFAPRFPDSEFSAVQTLLQSSGMNLGLWMTPMHFHPEAIAFQENPQWGCWPINAGLLAIHQADPDGGSNEAGILQWNPEAITPGGGKAIDYVEGRIRRAIDEWGVKYFKFDFTVWLDCGGASPVDMYGYRESFMAMLDRIIKDHPDVTIQMDETNDYRLFPFEALARGPTWYQNGSPQTQQSLHANHVLAPYLPPYALGRAALRTGDLASKSADYQMAVALLSHFTFFNDLTGIPAAVRPRIRAWTDYFKAHREDFAQFTYPLLAEDPLGGDTWAAFQAWNPETGRGALLVYRQDSAEAVKTIRLRNIADGNYKLFEAPSGQPAGVVSAAQLRAGIAIALPSINSAKVLRIERLGN